MDEKVAKWILEFLLRKPIDEKIINGVLSSLPFSNKDCRLKKTILLRKIESETSNGSVSEKLLELLELIEELNHRAGKTASDLMKKAYCAVAVDCTVRFLEENVEENGKYFEAVERIWRNRICKMEGLLSEESNQWLADVEAAVWDASVCEKILMRNTRNEALKAVRGYLKEAWKSMGPTFLELVASKFGYEVEKLGFCEDGGGDVVGSDNPCRELVAGQGGLPKGHTLVRRKHVAVKTRRPRGAKISEGNEEAESSMNVVNNVPICELEKVQEALQSNSLQLHATVSDSHADASRAAHTLSCEDNVVLNHKTGEVQEALQSNSLLQHASVSDSRAGASQAAHNLSCKDNDVPIHKMDEVQEALQSNSLQPHTAVIDSCLDASRDHNPSSTKATDNVSNVNASNKQTRPPVVHVTPEVRRVQEALKTSSRELHVSVTDPLPEALEIAKQTLPCTGAAGNHDTSHTTAVEKHDMNSDAVLPNLTQSVIHAPRETTENNTENVEKKDKLTGNARGNETRTPKERPKRKCSLMEPNGTSHTYEWDDSDDNVGRGGLSLPPSPKRSRVSALAPYAEKKSYSMRERKKWTPEEEEKLREAVKNHGRNWKLIRDIYIDTFKERTNVDLKDKWRNMSRS
ncbi:uncharacterized protein LOC110736398 [Chenopodium quinoa]|uniref:Uncharacterized protein n=1 Tax=Chenopodium quinoa TaxID=63459 RepID=A0A803KMM9_CHEQI|nr:uncharacterized protein LOC110736398 [Chenopodium quinoa]